MIAVRDLAVSRQYYEEVLGFTVDHSDSEWVMVERDGVRIHLGCCPEDPAASEIGCHNWFATIYVDNIAALEKEYLGKNATFARRLRRLGEWLDFVIQTPDGHRLVFHHFPIPRGREA